MNDIPITNLVENQEKIESLQDIQESLTPENIELFHTIFKGRDDIVPKHWKSKRRDKKSGYSFLCKNKWDTELCNLKKDIRNSCKTCENKEYVPFSDDLIKAHIKGEFILGVYPLLKDNTCYFIAADFDRHKMDDPDPLEDVKKYVEVCKVQEIPYYVLRSKSGKGYHVYIFFSDAVPAWKARVVTFALLEEVGIISEDIELSTFDRLFPNQDELSGKKLGNLIVLPFQGKACQKGHTLILNSETNFQEPYANQWEQLSKIEKASENLFDSLIKEWNLKKEPPKRKNSEFEPIQEEQNLAVFSRIKAGCKFIKHCCDDAETLPEPEWYACLTIIVRCIDGRRQTHKFSEDHPAYNYEETEIKLEHALNDSGPYHCKTIEKDINSKYCRKCLSKGIIKSPILLGYDAANDELYSSIIKGLNKLHAVIMIGGKCHVLNEIVEPVFNRPDISFSSYGDFRNYYANRLIPHPSKPNKLISCAELWFTHKDRRQYKDIVFDPSGNILEHTYNLWKGFAIKPKKGEWKLFKRHIYEVIANRNKTIFKWILAWFARIIQDPGGKRPGTAIVLRGKQGTGKGILVNSFGQIFGKHFIQIAQSSQVTGRFNSHFKDVILAFVDEGFWAGDKQAEGVIKNIITEPFITIEQKGKDIIRVKNNVNLIFASNNDWVIPAGLEERRFFVLDVSDKYQQNHRYFKAIINQIDNGGLEAIFYDLLEMDISGVDLRNFEQTEGLFEQKLYSMSNVQKYWYERLCDGKLISSRIKDFEQYSHYIDEFEWSGEVLIEDQYYDYLAFARSLNDRYPLCEQQFGLAIQKMCKNTKKIRRRVNGERKHYRIFPSLKKCREEFAQMLKMNIDWGEEENE